VADLKLALVISAIDRASAPLRGIAAAVTGIGHVVGGATKGFATFGLAVQGLQTAARMVTAPLAGIVDTAAEFEKLGMRLEALAQSDSYEEFIKEFEKINYRFKSDIRRESPEWSIAGFIDFFNQIIEFAREEKKKYLHVPRQTEISPEEEEKAKLGKFALPQIRNDLPRSVTKLDPNTSYENELEQDIETHVRSTSNPIDKKHVDYIRDALKHGWYPNIFKAPNVDVVYRGIVVRYATAERLFGITQEQVEDLKNDGQPFDIEINKTVKSSNNEDKAVSWSKQLRVAEGFSWSGFSEQAVGIIFHAHVADNPGLFWDLSASTKYDTEDEVIALSNLIKIFKITVK
jgi:hypothetical protein